jgi:hypothetical protein
MKKEIENELNELSPLLADLKKRQDEDPFKTPKFYFDNLTDKILVQANNEGKTSVVTTTWTPQYKTFFERLKSLFTPVSSPRLAMAFASLALVIVGSWYVLTRKTVEKAANSPQIYVNQPPIAPQTTPSIDDKILEKPLKPIVLENMPKAEMDTYIKDNLVDSEDLLTFENAPKLANTEGSKLTHPQSGLTEEELESYLIDTAEEGDFDGSDNKF